MKTRNSPYRKYSDFLRETFGEKVYKVPVKLPGTCPNRDGTLGRGGCIFCGEEGGSFENLEIPSIRGQIRENKRRMADRYHAEKFIGYFQNFSNTYFPLEEFQKYVLEALKEDLVGLNISTRPDTIPDTHLDFLQEVCGDKMITIELGLQTANENTLEKIGRGHDLASFIDAVLRIHDRGMRVSAHVILDLPWDDLKDTIRTARILSALRVEEVKIHNLYLIPGTKMAILYEKGEIALLSKEDYEERVITFLEHLSPDIVIGRLGGRAPQSQVPHSNWDTSWWKIQDEIVESMLETHRFQGGAVIDNQILPLRKDEEK